MKGWIKNFFASHKTTFGAIVVGAIAAGATALQAQTPSGHIDWKIVGTVAVGGAAGVIAGLAKSPLTPASAPPKDDSTGDDK